MLDHLFYTTLQSKRLVLISLLLLLSGCPISSKVKQGSNSAIDAAQNYLQKARQSEGSVRNDWLLKATAALLQSQRTDKALGVLQNIDVMSLSPLQSDRYYSLLGQGLNKAQRWEQSLVAFTKVKNLEQLSLQQQRNHHDYFASTLLQSGRFFESAKQGMHSLAITDDILERESVKETLWQALLQLPNPEIYQNSLNSTEVSGWLELLDISREYTTEPDKLVRALAVWKARYSNHLANQNLPLDLANAMSVKTYGTDKVAVLLPFSGLFSDSGVHIQRGLLSAYYEQHSPEDKATEIQFYDTMESPVTALYDQAVNEGATFVIGPLRQQAVDELMRHEALSVPVLAINRSTTNNITPIEDFYQFGLPIEDEIAQVATRIFTDGLTRGLLMLPNNSRGDRALTQFTETFEQAGGSVQGSIRYSSELDYAKSVRAMLGVDSSMQRHSRLQQLAGVPLEFQARRRQDIDFIFFLADPDAGRRIKPFIDYYYAHDVALYSSSTIYSGQSRPVPDGDLNKVIFPDMPALISDSKAMRASREQLNSIWPESASDMAARLYALGYDSYQLIPELSKLKYFPNYRLEGLTGNLYVNEQGLVLRNLQWAQFKQGLAKEIPAPTNSDVNQSQ